MAVALTAQQFKNEHPHFKAVSEDLIGFMLKNAALDVHEGTFGPDYRRAVFLRTAHLLSIDAKGQKARLQSSNAQTTYGRMFDELLSKKTLAGRVV